jgi:ABC-type polysaccharide/polyol phosphate export permease
MSKMAELAGSRELFWNLTLRELRGKYKRSVLGWTWSLLNPLANMLIFTLVFGYFLKVKPPRGNPSGLNAFPFFLLCGMLPWNYLANGMSGGMGTLIGNGNLIKKVYFPREVLVAANVTSWLASFGIEMGVLAAVLLIVGNMVLPWIVPTLVLMALLTIFVLGMGLTLSVLNVYFRDVQHFMAIFLQLWFYATPVVYPITVVPRTAHVFGSAVPARSLYQINPMVAYVQAFRNCFYDLRLPAAGGWAWMVASAAVSLGAGFVIFSRFEPRLAEEL